MKNWKHSIKIKHLFEDVTTPELVVTLCESLVSQLNSILKQYESSDNGDEIYYDLELIIDNFDHLKSLADGEIPECEWKNYSFNGDFESQFNGYLTDLYEFADQDKFLWID